MIKLYNKFIKEVSKPDITKEDDYIKLKLQA
jgi:hypothetical protein